MKLNLGFEFKEGIWTDYDSDVSFKIRYASPEFVKRTRKKHTKKKWIRGQQEEIINDTEWDRDLWDYIIEDWKGIEIDNNIVAECNIDNKLKLVNISSSHSNFIFEFATDIENYTNKEKEAEEIKN